MNKLVPCLWFANEAEEAVRFYVTLLPDSDIVHVMRSPIDTPAGKADQPLLIEFTLAGRPFLALNGGQPSPRTLSFSFSASCGDQAEVDQLWSRLTDNGGTEVQCGWVTDRYGYSWQVFPEILPRMLADPDREKAGRVMRAMMGMVKLDVAALKRAYDGA